MSIAMCHQVYAAVSQIRVTRKVKYVGSPRFQQKWKAGSSVSPPATGRATCPVVRAVEWQFTSRAVFVPSLSSVTATAVTGVVTSHLLVLWQIVHNETGQESPGLSARQRLVGKEDRKPSRWERRARSKM